MIGKVDITPVLRGAVTAVRRRSPARSPAGAAAMAAPLTALAAAAPVDPVEPHALPAPISEADPAPRSNDRLDEAALTAACQQGYEEGYEEGFMLGREAGYRAGEGSAQELAAAASQRTQEWATEAGAQHDAALARLSALIETMAGQSVQAIEQAEDAIVALVYESVCSLVGTVAMDRDGVSAMVRHVVAAMGAAPVLSIRMHPQDVAALREDANDLFMRTDNHEVVWIGDSAMHMGGCMVETSAGTLDARLNIQLERLRDTFVRARRQDAPPAEGAPC